MKNEVEEGRSKSWKSDKVIEDGSISRLLISTE